MRCPRSSLRLGKQPWDNCGVFIGTLEQQSELWVYPLDVHLGTLGFPEGSISCTDTNSLPREKASASANSRDAFDPVGIVRDKLCR